MTNGAIVTKYAMRLRSSRTLPQAGTQQGESRPDSSGSPTYSGGDTVSRQTAQSTTVAEHDLPSVEITSHSSSSSSPNSLFESPSSSPKSYEHAHTSRSTSSLSSDAVQEAPAAFLAPISDITEPTRDQEVNTPTTRVDTTHTQTIDINTPARSVLQDMLPATTLAGKSRQRMKWTHEINCELLRSYYIVTHCETNLSAYRPQLHQKFIETFPELSHISEQRLADQIRVIHKNNRIPLEERENIKQSVTQTVDADRFYNNDNDHTITNTTQNHVLTNNIQNHENTDLHELHINTQNTQSNIPTTSNITHETYTESTQLTSQEHNENNLLQNTESLSQEAPIQYNTIENTFNEMLIKFTGTEPTLRPMIPKLQINKHTIRTVNIVNELIDRHLQTKEHINLEELHETIYCAASTVTKIHIKKENKSNIHNNNSSRRPTIPQWERRITNKIAILRKDIGQLTQYLAGKLSLNKQRRLNPTNKTNDEITDKLDLFKQKLQAASKRLRRYKISNQRRADNKLFNTNQKLFYRKFSKDDITIIQPPNATEVQQYWENMWSKPVQHQLHSSWATIEEREMSNINPMSETHISTENVTQAVKYTLNWKSPGPDKVQNYWLKYFSSTHKHLAIAFNHILHNPLDMPHFLTHGITYLKPKDTDTTNPSKYRPITCLPTIYKLLTSIITQKVNAHITQNKIIPEEQKGCCKGSRGCKEQLVIDTEIHNQVKQKHRNLHYAYIDYQKAFDSIPHSWLIHILKIYKTDNTLIQFLKHAMSNWTTRLNIRTNSTTVSTSPIKIKRGIFQGDSFSPLWFCLALNPLSRILNATGHGYKIDISNNIKLTHLLYMDDIKLYAANREQLDDLLKRTEEFSNDIKMKFGIEKCKVNSIIAGQFKKVDSHNLEHQEGAIDSMDFKESYKYLGYKQTTTLNHTEIKNSLKDKFKQRLNQILNTHLSSRNKTKAVNTYAIPILTYSFGVIKWSDTELESLNTTIRTASYRHNIHHIHSAVQRFTLSRKLGGRGFIDIKNLHYKQIDNLRSYFLTKANDSTIHNAIVNLPHFGTPLQLSNTYFQPKLKIIKDTQKIEAWKAKALHGKYPHQLDQEHIDRTASCTWLTKGNIFGETEGFLIAIQDQVIKTKNYSKYILKEPLESDRCRLCQQSSETIEHITGGCHVLATKEYTHRHDNVAKHIHQQLALKYKLLDNYTPYYQYKPKNVIENNTAKLYWDRDIITDRTILSNRPDITLTLKQTNTTYLIDITVPNTHNLKQKYTEKIQKYIPLADEIKQMWHQETVKIVPIVISSTGVIPKTLKIALNTLQLPENTYIPLQKSVVIDTCSIVRRFLNPTSLPLQTTQRNTHTSQTTSTHHPHTPHTVANTHHTTTTM